MEQAYPAIESEIKVMDKEQFTSGESSLLDISNSRIMQNNEELCNLSAEANSECLSDRQSSHLNVYVPENIENSMTNVSVCSMSQSPLCQPPQYSDISYYTNMLNDADSPQNYGRNTGIPAVVSTCSGNLPVHIQNATSCGDFTTLSSAPEMNSLRTTHVSAASYAVLSGGRATVNITKSPEQSTWCAPYARSPSLGKIWIHLFFNYIPYY